MLPRSDTSDVTARDPGSARSALPWAGSGAAWWFHRAVLAGSFALIPVVATAHGHAYQFATVPSGVRLILFSIKDEPQVISYDPASLTSQDLQMFAVDLCDSAAAEIQKVKPFLRQRLLGKHRAHIFCTGVNK